MDSPLLPIFTGAVSVALLLQGIALIGIFLTLRKLAARIESVSVDVQKKLLTLCDDLHELSVTLKPLAGQIQALQENLTTTSRIVRNRVADLDEFLQASTDAARLQIARIQDLVETISAKIEETFDIFREGVLSPVTEVSAVMRGLRVGLDYFLRGRKISRRQPHQDEELFI